MLQEQEKTFDKIRYSLDGVMLSHITDRSVNNDIILRESGNKQLVISNNKILSSIHNNKLRAIERPDFKTLFVENSNIGVIDIETYKAIDNTSKVYALGFVTNKCDKPTIFYLDQNTKNSTDLIRSLVDQLLESKYSNVKFYVHNLGGYDVIYIVNTLYTYNDEISYVCNKNESEYEYKYKCYFNTRDDKVIRAKISKGSNSFTIFDSLALLPRSLAELGKDFNVATIKSKFPYAFSVQDNLFYKGPMPAIEYYSDITLEEYESMSLHTWSFKDETIRYLSNDLLSLQEVLTKANKQVFLDYNTDMTSSMTISGLAVRIFWKDFYKNNIPNINKHSIYKDIKQGYYGGMTEVYKPYGSNLFYYDVNSLYPYVALQDMPGLTCDKLFYYDHTDINIDNLFGFFYCRIETPLDIYLGLLPVRTKSGLTFPLGKWYGWYFSEELKFAKTHGYKIQVLKGYSFNREKDVFTEYINKVYKIKSTTTNKSQKTMAKSLLNNLLGRFGINLEKPITKIVSKKEFDIIYNKSHTNKKNRYIIKS